ncbi:aspartic peptidase domain-containing protein [Aspergillus pseudotamarii]|uniref:Aspartic peptidase domain-containing protein n=1 Tax=Aspergillus pseudotamarii TaxID=132259 RepID=A0A5N6T4J5_ASPPS|nr:aspartic peptidase domain-containing protein [Aspergillus pseudotamarii]KAE8141234.1 aspartic peptidase domain-containing protein [Aspergillus pseudotamarii]
MFNKRRVPCGLTITLLFSLQSVSLSAAGDCAPYPVSVNLNNVTLGNTTARGVSLSVGSPKQSFAFLPQWPLNSTFVYGTDGYCGESWSEAGCRTFRGGAYDSSSSTTYKDAPSNHIEASPYPDFTWGKDDLIFNSNTTLLDFPIGIARSDWGAQGYHPQVAFGLGRNSTILNSLYTAGHIASRSWAMFWGRTGGTADTQQDGNFVFGGFDKSKASGDNYTSDLNYSNKNCASGMLVTITDLELNFPNGTTASLFDGMQSSAILACIVPDYPVLMTLPRDPYFERFESLTNESFSYRGFGVYYYGMLYPNPDSIYTGDLTVTLNNGFSVRIPNDQLVVPNLTIDPSTGSLHANGSTPELVINSIQQVNQGDLPQLGRQFLSSAYLMSNQDSNTFTLWNAALEEEENLVAIDTNNKPVDIYCAATPTSTSSSTSSPHSTGNHDKKLSTGAIVGIAIGSAAALAIVAAGVFLPLIVTLRLNLVRVIWNPTFLMSFQLSRQVPRTVSLIYKS